jgi:hypothetical protein
MATVGRPVHGVNLGQMAFECSPGLHANTRQGVGLVLRNFADCSIRE